MCNSLVCAEAHRRVERAPCRRQGPKFPECRTARANTRCCRPVMLSLLWRCAGKAPAPMCSPAASAALLGASLASLPMPFTQVGSEHSPPTDCAHRLQPKRTLGISPNLKSNASHFPTPSCVEMEKKIFGDATITTRVSPAICHHVRLACACSCHSLLHAVGPELCRGHLYAQRQLDRQRRRR